MARMETDCDISFSLEKASGCQVQVWLKVVEIVQTCCCRVDFLQKITFNYLVWAN